MPTLLTLPDMGRATGFCRALWRPLADVLLTYDVFGREEAAAPTWRRTGLSVIPEIKQKKHRCHTHVHCHCYRGDRC